MRKTVNTISFSFFISCFICFLCRAKEAAFAQPPLKLPIVVPAGKPEIIRIPKTPGENYSIKNEGGYAIMRPPRVFNLPVSSHFAIGKQSFAPTQLATGKGLFTTYTTDNGLALDAVFSSCIDHFGNLWFGTQGGGVSKYDGKSFVNYTTAQGLASNNIWNILEDKSGNMWFATSAGACKYDGKSFERYLASSNVWCIEEDKKGNFWFGTTGNGVSKYDGKSFETYTVANGLVSNTVKDIFADREGNVWFGADGGGLNKYDGKSFSTYTTADGLVNNFIYSIEEDNEGNIWLGTGAGISKFDRESFLNYTATQQVTSNAVRSILKDKNGNLWFASDGDGAFIYDGRTFVNYTAVQGLTNNYISSILEDNSGNIWFGTSGGGVSKYEGKAFVNYTIDQGLGHNNAWSMLEDEGKNLWVGTYGGLSRFDGNYFHTYALPGMNMITLSIMEDDDKNIWLGTYGGGLFKYDGKSFVLYNAAQGLKSNSIRSIVKDKTGNIWFATDGGLCYYNGTSFKFYTKKEGLINDLIYCMVMDNEDNLWVGTNEGLSRFDGKSFLNFTTEQGLINNAVFSITTDKTGRLWMGSPNGLSCLIPEAGKFMFKTFTTEDGLPDNYVTQVAELPNKKIVVGTNLGIAIFDAPDFKEKKLKNMELFNSPLGYPVKDVNAGVNSIYRDHKGLIWIATGSDKTGLARFDYTAVSRNLTPPRVVIQNLKIDEENICWENLRIKKEKESNHFTAEHSSNEYDSLSLLMSEFNAYGKDVPQTILDNQQARFDDISFGSITKFYPIPESLVLPYDHNQITFEFAAIEPARPFLVKYQYILEGYNKEWSPVTDRTSVSFGNMDEGLYTFKLKAQNPYGVWSEPVIYTFKVLPPWWRTWWMYSLYVVLGICTVALTTWLNGKRLRLKAKELAEEVRKATVTILEQKKVVEQQKHFVEEKNKHITDSINYAQRIQNAILPENSYIQSLFDHHFIYYQPKEIVSGDFYWFGQKDDKVIFAAVDCTGHGVPGALMSMIGNTLLNEIVNGKGVTESDEILNHLRNDIIHALKQTDAPESQKDGMDIALCVLDKNRNILEFSGAHNSLYHFRKDVFTEFKADKQAIGYEKKEKQAFLKHKIEIQKGDILYLFTDGFVDQKGGSDKKKFYYKPFRELLASIKHEPMERQEEILRDTFNIWKDNLEQIDDVLVIGIRL